MGGQAILPIGWLRGRLRRRVAYGLESRRERGPGFGGSLPVPAGFAQGYLGFGSTDSTLWNEGVGRDSWWILFIASRQRLSCLSV